MDILLYDGSIVTYLVLVTSNFLPNHCREVILVECGVVPNTQIFFVYSLSSYGELPICCLFPPFLLGAAVHSMLKIS